MARASFEASTAYDGLQTLHQDTPSNVGIVNARLAAHIGQPRRTVVTVTQSVDIAKFVDE